MGAKERYLGTKCFDGIKS